MVTPTVHEQSMGEGMALHECLADGSAQASFPKGKLFFKGGSRVHLCSWQGRGVR